MASEVKLGSDRAHGLNAEVRHSCSPADPRGLECRGEQGSTKPRRKAQADGAGHAERLPLSTHGHRRLQQAASQLSTTLPPRLPSSRHRAWKKLGFSTNENHLGRKPGNQDSGLKCKSRTHHQAEAYRVPSPREPDSSRDLYLSDCIQLFQDGILILLSEVAGQQLINLLWKEGMY